MRRSAGCALRGPAQPLNAYGWANVPQELPPVGTLDRKIELDALRHE